MAGYRKTRNYGRRRSARRPVARKPRAKKVSPVIKKYIKRVIHSQIENKQANVIDDINIGSWFGDVNLNCKPLMPVAQGTPQGGIHIDQGVGQSDRVGNIVKTRKLLFRYIMTPLPQSNAITPYNNPQEVRIFFGYLKNQRMTFPDVSTFNNLFQFGNNDTSPFNNLWDMTLPVNDDLFTIVKQVRHKVGNSGYADVQSSGIKQFNYYSNNDFKMNCMRTIDLTKFLNKTLKFNDTTGTCDSGLYVWFIAVNADGSQSIQNIATIRCQYSIEFQYEDA